MNKFLFNLRKVYFGVCRKYILLSEEIASKNLEAFYLRKCQWNSRFSTHMPKWHHVIENEKKNEFLFIVKRFPHSHCTHILCMILIWCARYGRGIDEQFYFYRSIKWYAHSQYVMPLCWHCCCNHFCIEVHAMLYGDLPIDLLSEAYDWRLQQTLFLSPQTEKKFFK